MCVCVRITFYCTWKQNQSERWEHWEGWNWILISIYFSIQFEQTLLCLWFVVAVVDGTFLKYFVCHLHNITFGLLNSASILSDNGKIEKNGYNLTFFFLHQSQHRNIELKLNFTVFFFGNVICHVYSVRWAQCWELYRTEKMQRKTKRKLFFVFSWANEQHPIFNVIRWHRALAFAFETGILKRKLNEIKLKKYSLLWLKRTM